MKLFSVRLQELKTTLSRMCFLFIQYLTILFQMILVNTPIASKIIVFAIPNFTFDISLPILRNFKLLF